MRTDFDALQDEVDAFRRSVNDRMDTDNPAECLRTQKGFGLMLVEAAAKAFAFAYVLERWPGGKLGERLESAENRLFDELMKAIDGVMNK